jgi:RNA polymerase primary sigma factor
MPPREERRVVEAAAGGDSTARDRLVEAFMPTIGGMAGMYARSTAVERSELIQEGVVGLLRALARFDPDVGAPFWAYASWWVRQAMQQLVSEMTRPFVLSDRALRKLARVKDARAHHLQAEGRDPTIADLVRATDFSREQVVRLLAVERAPRGLDEHVGGESDSMATLGDAVADPVSEDDYVRVVETIESHEVGKLSARLPKRERHIVRAHYGFGCPARTLRQIALEMELSVERVRQLEERALGRLRAAVTAAA